MRISKEKQELSWRVGGWVGHSRSKRTFALVRWDKDTSTRLALVWPLSPTGQDEFGA